MRLKKLIYLPSVVKYVKELEANPLRDDAFFRSHYLKIARQFYKNPFRGNRYSFDSDKLASLNAHMAVFCSTFREKDWSEKICRFYGDVALGWSSRGRKRSNIFNLVYGIFGSERARKISDNLRQEAFMKGLHQ